MQISAEDYPGFKAFFVWIVERRLTRTGRSPIDALNETERGKPAMARKGLAMAIGDVIELLQDLSADEETRLDAELSAEGLITLGQVRVRFWKRLEQIRKNGVRDETDYYALRNVVETLPDAEQAAAWELLAAYEAKAAAQ